MPENTANKTRSTDRPTEAVNELAQQGAAYGKDIYEKSKAAAEETNKALQETYSTVSKGAADFNAVDRDGPRQHELHPRLCPAAGGREIAVRVP